MSALSAGVFQTGNVNSDVQSLVALEMEGSAIMFLRMCRAAAVNNLKCDAGVCRCMHHITIRMAASAKWMATATILFRLIV